MEASKILAAAAVLLILLTASGCGERVAESGLRTCRMRIGDRTFTLEIADNSRTRARGLMHRESMPEDWGMIFVFAEDAPRSFYMKNTLIPLDILYVNAAGEVVSIHQMQPLDERSVLSEAPAKWAIELNQGVAARVGVKKGDVLTIPREAGGPR
jgi:uncharacterized membrane protein (UPF0127 family)